MSKIKARVKPHAEAGRPERTITPAYPAAQSADPIDDPAGNQPPGAATLADAAPADAAPAEHTEPVKPVEPLAPAELLEAVRWQLDPEAAQTLQAGDVPDGAPAHVVDEFRQVMFEDVYLQSCSDVGEAVRAGHFASGYVHWMDSGRKEIADRQRSLPGTPDALDVSRRADPRIVSPATMALLDHVDDWRALIFAFSAGLSFERSTPTPSNDSAPPPAVYDEQPYVPSRDEPGRASITQVVVSGLDRYYAQNPRVIAFYLPQYHRVKENDEWWGEGFTEWTNVRKATPNFVGHIQPHVPDGGEYYDLADPGVQPRQAALAREYGITAFCYYLYWFDGRRLLERPLDQMLADKSINHEFCVCWANENWTRTWDGKADDILVGQKHTPESDRRFIHDAMKYLRDPRYLRVDGKLTLLVYRVDLLPNASDTAEIWRDEVRRAGLGELHLCAVQFYGVTDPAPWGFDAAVEFPPHGWLVQPNLMRPQPAMLNPDFEGFIFDYEKCVDWALAKPIPDYRWYRGVFPGWDNTARRQNTPHIFANSNHIAFERWMSDVLRQTVIMAPPEHQLVFVNAWNEWGEGAHLEPDARGGRLNLMALNAALNAAADSASLLAVLGRLRQQGNYPGRAADELRLLHQVRGQEQALRALADRLRALDVNPYL